MLSACTLDDSLKGQFGIVDSEVPTIDITTPLTTDLITYWNQEAFVVTGTCFLKGKQVRVQAAGAIADPALCQDNKTFVAALNFKTPGVPDGVVTISANYMDLPMAGKQDSVILNKRTYPEIFVGNAAAASEGSALQFVVTFDHVSSVPFTFEWSTQDGTAQAADADFVSVTSQQFTVSANVLSVTLSVLTSVDSFYELDENMSVVVSNPSLSYISVGSGSGTILNNDPAPGLLVYDASGSEGSSLGFVVSLTALSKVDVPFSFLTQNGTASNLADFNQLTGSGVVSALQSIFTISVPTNQDSIFETNETFSVTLSNVQHATIGVIGTDDVAIGTILNDDSLPNLFVSDDSKNEGLNLIFTVTLDRLTEVAAVFDWQSLTTGTAASGTDYTAGVGRFTLPVGVNQGAITIVTSSDSTFEADETLFVSLTPVSAVAVANPGADNVGQGTILNDDSGPLLFIDDLTINEGETSSLMVSLSQVSGLDAVFSWRTFDGSALAASLDYTSVPFTTVTIPAGSLTFGLVSFAALDDDLDEDSETASVSLTAVSGVAAGDLLSQITIHDINPAPLVFVEDVALTEPNTVPFVVSLSQVSGKNIWFNFSSVDTGSAGGGGVDFNNFSSSRTIAAGQLAITITGFANAVDDLISESLETYQITLTGLNNVGVGRTGSQVEITDNDVPPSIFVVGDAKPEGTNLEFVVTLSGLTAAPVTFDFQTFNGTAVSASDYTAQNRSYTISTGSLALTIPVLTGNDSTFELDESFNVTISNVSSNATITSPGVDNSATGTIQNNDSSPLLFVSDASFNEDETGQFAVSLSAVSDLPVIFTWVTDDDGLAQEGVDYTAASGQGTIPAGALYFTIPVVALPTDTLDEPLEDFSLDLAVVSFAGAGDLAARGEIIDNDGAPNIYITDLNLSEGNAGWMLVSLAAISGLPVSFDYQSFNTGSAVSGADYTALPSTRLTIPAGVLTISFQVTSLEDTVFETNEYFDVSLSNITNAGMGDISGLVTIEEDDAQPILAIYDVSGAEGTTLAFKVSLSVASDVASTFSWLSYDNTATTADSDYSSSTGSGTIAAGSLQYFINLISTHDTKLENNETLYVSLSGLGNVSVAAVANLRATGTLTNNDASPLIYINDLSLNEGQTQPVSISLSEVSGLETVFTWNTFNGLPVTLSAASGSDYLGVTNQVVTIPAETRTIAINATAFADMLDEYNENYIISLSSLANASAGDIEGIITIQDQNAEPALFISDLTLDEGDGGVIAVSLDQVSGRDLWFTYQTSNGTATAGDYSSIASTTVTIPAGTLTLGISLSTTEDVISEGNENFFVSLTSATYASIVDDTGLVTITDDDGTVEIFISGDSKIEGTDLILSVSLSGISAFNVTYDFNTLDGTAFAADADYSSSSASRVILAGSSLQTITISTGNDTKFENDETMLVSLSNVLGANINVGVATGTVENNDSGPLLYIDDLSFNEGVTGTFSVSLSQVSGLPVVFTWATYDGTALVANSDYSGVATTTVTIAPETLTISNVRVEALADTLDENAETFSITLTVLSGAGTGDLAGVGTIQDTNVPPDIFIADASSLEGDALGFVVSLSVVSGLNVVFNYQSYNGTATTADSDYTAISGTATIAALSSQITISLNTTEDTKLEIDETLSVSLSSVVNATVSTLGSDDVGAGTIQNDDSAPQLFISSPTVNEGGTLVFQISISEISALDVAFSFQTVNGTALTTDTDYNAVSGGHTIGSGSLNYSISVVSNEDTKLENAEDFIMSLSNLTGATVASGGLVGTGTINNDDAAPLIFINDLSYNEGTTGSHFVSLSEVSGLPAVYSFTVYNIETIGADYTVLSNAQITIAAETLASQVQIHALTDGLDEFNETYRVSLTAIQDLQAGDLEAVGTIQDQEAEVQIFIQDVTKVEPSTSPHVVTLSQASGKDIVFNLSSVATGSATNNLDYSQISTSDVTIPAGSISHSFNIIILNDALFEGDETFNLTLTAITNAQVGRSGAIVTIADDDGLPQLTVYPSSGNEGDFIYLTASLSEVSGLPVTFDWRTYDVTGQAVAGSDYTAQTLMTYTLTAGQLTIALPVAALTDAPLDENSETFTVSISNAGNATIVGATANGTIQDVDSEPQVFIADASAVNEGETLNYTISLSKISGRDVVVSYQTLDGTATSGTSDYTSINSTPITFPAGTGTLAINVVALTDDLNEPSETVLVTLTSLTNVTAGDLVATGTINDINADPFIYTSDASVTEEQTAHLTVSLNVASAIPVVFTWSTLDGTATNAAGDYGTATGTMTIAAFAMQVTISIPTLDDGVNEATENFFVTLSAISDAQNGDVLGQVDILENDPQPGIYVSDAAAVIEGGTSLFTISLNYASGQDVSFDYRTLNDTALAPDDYTSISLTRATIPAGQTTFAVLVTTLDDAKDDSANSEYFFVTISSPNLATISVASGTGEITDNDNAPQIYISDASGNEGQTVSFFVTLSGLSENDVDFDLATVNGTAIANGDYASQTISGAQIPAGSLSYTLNVVLNNDNIYEATENFSVSITSTTASNGDLSGAGSIADTTGIPSLYLSDASTVTEGETSQFVVTLSHLADTEIIFNWSTTDGTARDQNTDNDFSGISTQSRTMGALSSSITLSVVTVDDAILEAQENYLVTVFGGSANVNIADGSGTALIDDNEVALNIFIVGDAKPEGTDLVFTVSISGTSAFNVTYSFNPFDGTATQADGDFTITGGTNVINAGSTSQAITVVTGNDTKLEASETFTLSLSNIIGATVANTGTDDIATGTIQNNDSSPFIYIDDLAINEAETLPLMVSLSQVSGLDAVFSWQTYNQTATSASGDYTAVATTQVTIPAGSLTVGLVTFRALDDNLDENSETALVSLTSMSNVSIAVPGSDDLAVVTINDINSAPLIFIPDIALTEPDTVDFIVSLSQVSGKDVWFGYSSQDTGSATGGGADFNNITQSNITIAAGLQVITLSGANAVDDLISEGTETYQITLSSINNAGSGKIGASVTITDNEAMPFLVLYGASENEGTPIQFIASLSGLSAGAVSFDFNTYSGTAISGTDFTENSSRHTIGAGSLQVTVAVNTTHEVLYELDETFSVTISNVSGSAGISISSAIGTILNNDSEPNLFIDDLTFGEETTGLFTVSISAVSGLNSVFSWQTYGNLDATEGTDYTATSGQMTIPAGSTVGTIPVIALPSDTLDESNEQFTLSLAITSGVLAGDLTSIGTITDNDGAPNLFVDDLVITEGNTGSLMISLSSVSGMNVTFDISSYDESANQPVDYQSISRTLTISAGQLTISAQAITEEDANFEGNETFRVSISNSINAGLGVAQNQVTIIDDDPMPVLTIYDISGAEGTTLNFIVSLNVPSDLESTFTWQSYNNTATVTDFDYTVTNGAGTIAAGSLQLTIPVISTPDTKLENDETLYVSLSGLGNVSVVAVADLRAAGTITNNDSGPLIFVNDLSLNEGQTQAFLISLSEVSGLESVFTWNTYNGSPVTLSAQGGIDYLTVANQVVTVPAETRTISVNTTAFSDSLDEYDENYLVSLSSLVNVNAGDLVGVVTVVDQSSEPILFISDIGINEGETGIMGISLSEPSAKAIVFQYLTVDGTATAADYVAISSTTVTLLPGEVTTSVSIVTTEDLINEGDHSFYVSLSSAQGATITDDLGLVTIIDDDFSTIFISDASMVLEGQTLQFVVSLSEVSATDVFFSWRTFDGTATSASGDYATQSLISRTISSGVLQVTLSVATSLDSPIEIDETLHVSLSNLSPNLYLGDDWATGTVRDPFCDTGTIDAICIITSQRTISVPISVVGTGSILIQPGGGFISDPLEIITFSMNGDISISSGTQLNGNFDFISRDFTLDANATISANVKGFQTGSAVAPGRGFYDTFNASGAGHGAPGANSTAQTGGAAYGTLTYPMDFGSNGGAAYSSTAGGAGGGRVVVKSSRTANIVGTIIANGGSGTGGSYASGGGSGGSILIEALTISGGGVYETKGGNATNGGSGSGGRIAHIILPGGSYEFSGFYNIDGGTSSAASYPSSPGTFYTNVDIFDYLCDVGSLDTVCEITQSKQLSSSLPLVGAGSISISSGARLMIVGGEKSYIDLDGELVLEGTLVAGTIATLSAGNMKVFGFWTGSVENLEATDLIVTGTLTGNIENSSLVTVSLSANSVLDANFLGFRGGPFHTSGTGPGFTPGDSYSTAGAGHGGLGGAGDSDPGGAVYGSLTYPVLKGSGSGGAGSPGAHGGGVVILKASQSAFLNGAIRTNGQNGQIGTSYPSGGGSGGSILVESRTIVGSGILESYGGTGGDSFFDGGGGAGGRIALLVLSGGDYSFSGNYNVNGGTAPVGSGPGSVGTFYTNVPMNDVICDVGDLDTICQVTSNKQISPSVAISGLGSISIASGATISLSGAGAFTIQLGEDFINRGTWRGALARLDVRDFTQSGFWFGDILSWEAEDVIISGTITGNIVDATLSSFDLASSGEINANFLGELASNGPGRTTYDTHSTGGAGHGGVGGTAHSGQAGGAIYGSLTFPTQKGSGSGGAYNGRVGSRGGGVVVIKSQSFSRLDGDIFVDGANGSGTGGFYHPGGGSGGSIYIEALTISGGGLLQSKGGTNGAGWKGGGGAGGRIAIWPGLDLWAGSHSVEGGTGYNVGSVGTFYRHAPPIYMTLHSPGAVEEGDVHLYVVSLHQTSAQTITFNWQTYDGTATTGDSDYSPQSAAVTMPPGVLAVTLTVSTTPDIQLESDETFYVSLSNLGNVTYTSENNLFATSTITNDDYGRVLYISDASVNEGESLQFVLSLNPTSPVEVTVDYQTHDMLAMVNDTDYTPASGTLTFAAFAATRTIVVPTIEDATFELDETLVLSLSNLQFADMIDDQGVGVIVNDDTTNVTMQFASSGQKALEDGWVANDHTGRLRLNINNAAQTESLTGFPVLVKLNSGRVDYSKTQNQGQDLRFYDANGNSLSHEIESWNEAGNSFVWVRLPTITGGSDDDYFYMYYGNATIADGQNKTGVWSDNFVGVWHMNDATDSSPRAANGTKNGTGTFIAGGAVGSHFQNNGGGSDNISATTTGLPLGASARTTCAYVQTDVLNGTERYFFGYGASSNLRWFAMSRVATDDLRLAHWTGDIDTINQFANTTEWNHFCATYDGTTSRLYKNGVMINSAARTLDTGNTAFRIGSSPSGSANWDGGIDEVRVSSVARSGDWLKAEYLNLMDSFLIYEDQMDRPAPVVITAISSEVLEAPLVANFNWGGSASNPADYVFSHNYISIPAGQTLGSVTVNILEDFVPDGGETIVVTLSTPSAGSLGSTTVHTIEIYDDTSWPVVDFQTAQSLMPENGWALPAWDRRLTLKLDNTASTENLFNFPVMVKLNSSRIDYAAAKADGSDLRFYDRHQQTLLSHEIEIWNPAGESIIWVKVPKLVAASSDNVVFMYYGNPAAADAQNASDVWSNGYLAAIHLSDVDGSAATSGPTIVGATKTGTITQVAGAVGGAVSLVSGANLRYGDRFDLEFNRPHTVSLWLRTNTTANSAVVSKMNEGGASTGYDMYVTSSGLFRSHLISTWSGNAMVQETSTTVNNNQWHHLSVAYSGSGTPAGRRVYMNGALNSTAPTANNVTATTQNAIDFMIGGRNNGSPYAGQIDEVRISNVERSAEWTEAEYRTMTDVMQSYFDEEQRSNPTIVLKSRRPLPASVNVGYLVSGTATLPGDHNLASGSFVLPAGQDNFSLTFSIADDAVFESTEQLEVSLSSIDFGQLSFNKEHTVDIIDDDFAAGDVFFTIYDAPSVYEGGTHVFMVSLNAPSTVNVAVNWATSNETAVAGTNYVGSSGVLTIAASQSFGAVSIPTLVAAGVSATEFAYNLVINSPSSGYLNNHSARGIILPDPGYISIFDAAAVNEGQTLSFIVTMSPAMSSNVTFNWQTLDNTATTANSDYTAVSATTTIPAGALQVTLRVVTTQDTNFEANETLFVSLSAPSLNAVFTDNIGVGTINNDDCEVTGWCQVAYLKAANANANDEFGYSLALDNETVAVGAIGEDSNQTVITNGSGASSDNSAGSSGAVYIFSRSNGTWAQQAYLKSSNSNAGDDLGTSVALEGDTLAVGAAREDSNQTIVTNGTSASSNNSNSSSGAVYVFGRTGSTWVQQAYLKAANNNVNDEFGRSVALSGNTLAVGTYLEDSNQTFVTNGAGASSDNTNTDSGAIYIFGRVNNTWVQQAYLKASNNNAGDFFGRSVALDGDTVIVGANAEASDQTFVTNGSGASSNNSNANSGAVYVFGRLNNTWVQQAYLKATNSGASDHFGWSVGIAGDTIAVGAYGEASNQTFVTNGVGASSDNSNIDTGAAYVFGRVNNTWVQQAYLKASNSNLDDDFGRNVAVGNDIVVVGAYGEDSNQTTVTNGGGSSSDNSISDSGAAYIFGRVNGTWVQQAYLKASNNNTGDYFGYAVAVDGDAVAVSALYEDSNQSFVSNGVMQASADNSATSAGAVYIFKYTGGVTPILRQAATQSDPATALPVEWSVEFSKEISDGTFTTADISLHASSTASGITWNLINSGDNRNYTLQATAVGSAGMIKPAINAGVLTDIDGYTNFASSPSFDDQVTYSSQPSNMFITDAFANEGGQLVFAVYLDQIATQNITFSYNTYDDFGGSWPFYVPASGTLTIPAGSQAVQVMVATIDDAFAAPVPAYSLYVSLSGVSPIASLVDDLGVGLIFDNDSSARFLSVSDAYAIEGDALQFIVSLDRMSTDSVTFSWRTSTGTAQATTDYTEFAFWEEGTISAGQLQVTISVPTTEDAISEITEYMAVEIQTLDVVLSDMIGVGVIEDDDTAPVVTLSVLDSATTPEGFIAEFIVTLTSPAPNNMTLIWSTTNGSATTGVDFVGQTFATQTILQGALSARIYVPTVFDESIESNETFSVVVHSANDAVIGDGVGAGVISNQLPLKLTYPDQMHQPIGYKLKVQGVCASAHGNVDVEVTDTTSSVTLSAACTSDAFLEYINVSSLNVGHTYLYIRQQLGNGMTLSQGRPLLKPMANCDLQADRQKTFAQGLAGGAGTAANPYVVCTANQLNEVRNATNHSFVLGNDIYFEHGDTNGDFVVNGSDTNYQSGSGWLPIPTGKVSNFNGQRFSIHGLTISRSTTDNVGLIAQIQTSNSTLRSVRFKDASISGQNRTSVFVGNFDVYFLTAFDIECLDCTVQTQGGNSGVVFGYIGGDGFSVLNKVKASGTLTGSGTSDNLGGIVGANAIDWGYFSGVSFDGTITGRDYIGGIISAGVVVMNARTNVVINGRNRIGGILGGGTGSVVKSLVEGQVNGSGFFVGCIRGESNSAGYVMPSGVVNSIALCSSVQGVDGGDYVGVLVGAGGWTTGDYFSGNYYASDMSCTNTGAGNCNTGYAVGSASRASLYDKSHAAYNSWDFLNDSSDGRSEIWVERSGAAPRLYFDSEATWTYQSPLNGQGTDASPYEISTPADLLEVSSNPHYQTATLSLSAHLDMSGTPAFKGLFTEIPFAGVLKGTGYEVSNITITGSTTLASGPTGFIGTAILNASVSDLKLDIGALQGVLGVGGLAGLWHSQGSAERMHITGTATITSGYGNTGGVFGFQSSGSATEVESHVSVRCIETLENYCGGLVGYGSYYASISNSYVTGSVTCNGPHCGGLDGRGWASISNSYSLANVTSTSNRVGGLIGESFFSNLTNVFASGNVTGNSATSNVGRISAAGGNAAANYYYSGKTCTNTGGGGCNTTGIAQATESYFYNPANAPLSSWNFTTIWESNSPAGYPTLRRTPQ